MGWLWFVIIGILAGWLAGLMTRGSGFGLVGDLVVGVLGSVVGGFVFNVLSIRAYGFVGGLAMATVGAAALLTLIRVVKKA
jgi:uncharacterized membrane protein YeaQ/YmgE (transglycosylase-associated protein family)